MLQVFGRGYSKGAESVCGRDPLLRRRGAQDQADGLAEQRGRVVVASDVADPRAVLVPVQAPLGYEVAEEPSRELQHAAQAGRGPVPAEAEGLEIVQPLADDARPWSVRVAMTCRRYPWVGGEPPGGHAGQARAWTGAAALRLRNG